MRRFPRVLVPALLLLAAPIFADDDRPGRDPSQPIDEEYTRKIREYTTESFFLSPLVDYLPAAKGVPTPKSVLGDVAGAPGKLPYCAEVYQYMRDLAQASPRVRVRTIGTTEEGREMIAVTVASEELLGKLEENRQRLAKLADPRSIRLDDGEAAKLVDASVPVYYITGTIHSPETGAPTALMELAYRLAVDESPYIRFIRDHVVTIITPVVEADGRDRQVDVYRWHLAHPGESWPPLVYWGHYVRHDNNRDAMGLTLNLTRNILRAWLDAKAQILHDLHESVPYLYDNTVGDGPYNAWLDPIVTNEWQMLGWNNVQEMTRFGMPGVFTHGTFDTWSPGYLMFIAATHNGVSRLYETFGNGGADTVERTLDPDEYGRTWWRQNPPLPKVKWSQRNNNNYEETGLLVSLHYVAKNGRELLRNFYLKAKRSVEKPKAEGPAAYVFPSDDPRPGAQAELLRLLQEQGCEVHRATAPLTATVAAKAKPKKDEDKGSDDKKKGDGKDDAKKEKPEKPASETRRFPAGSYVVRMDQPYSRIADAMLDYQYWSPDDPQKNPYDDTGWTFGELYGVSVSRVPDVRVLSASMELVSGPVPMPGGLQGDGAVFAIANNADNGLVTLRYRFPDADVQAAEEAFEAAGKKFPRGTLLYRGVPRTDLSKAAADLGLAVTGLSTAPKVATHPLRAPRVALIHTWIFTQDEGWWREAFDQRKVPFTYISTQVAAATPDLKAKYDVIVFPPGGDPDRIVAGLPMFGNPIPWKTTSLTPNLGKIDETNDIRPGLGLAGLENLRRFVSEGGLLITAADTAQLAVQYGLAPGVFIRDSQKLKLTGSVVRSKLVDAASPIVYGYPETPAIFSFDGPIFELSDTAGRLTRRRKEDRERATGRGTAEDPDYVVGRVASEAPEEPKAEAWEAQPLTDEQRRNNPFVIPPALRPRVPLRYGDSKELLISGLLEGGGEIAQHPAVVDATLGKGHVLLFSNNPFWRGETRGSESLVYNAILNFDHLDAGRKVAEK